MFVFFSLFYTSLHFVNSFISNEAFSLQNAMIRKYQTPRVKNYLDFISLPDTYVTFDDSDQAQFLDALSVILEFEIIWINYS